MRKVKTTYHARDIWIEYARCLLLEFPKLRGVYKDKIPNHTIFKGGREVMSYTIFVEVLNTFFDFAKKEICRGKTLVLKSRLGNIRCRRVERNHRTKTINYARTAEQPKVWNEEKQKYVPSKIIYHTSDDWCRIGWHKNKMAPSPQGLYEFVPTKDLRNGKGFKQMLSKILNEDPYVKFTYTYYPLQRIKKKEPQEHVI